MSDVYGAGIDQAKLFQTISLAVADATKEVLEGEQANRIRELEARNEYLLSELRAVGELPGKWLRNCDRDGQCCGPVVTCADELEALLKGGA